MIRGIGRNLRSQRPASSREGEGVTVLSARGHFHATGSLQMSARTQRRVLVVDDEEVLRMVAAQLLELCRCRPRAASDVGEAEVVLQQAGVDLLILDLTMDGSEDLYRSAEARGVPVVLSTGLTTWDIARRFPDHPPDQVLQKPYGLRELEPLLRRIFGGASGAAE